MPPCLKISVSIGLLVIMAGCEPTDGRTVVAPPPPVPVSALSVTRRRSFPARAAYFGRIEAARTTEMSFELSGRLESVQIQEGDFVEKGRKVAYLDTGILKAQETATLASLETEQAILQRLVRGEREEVVEAARAKAKQLEVESRRLSADLSRAEKVFAGLAISKSDYDEVAFSYQAAIHAFDAAKSRLKELESGSRAEDISAQRGRVAVIRAELDLLRVRLNQSEITVPFSGVCTARLVDEGTIVAAGQPVFRFSESHQLEARFAVPEHRLDAIDHEAVVLVAGESIPVERYRKTSEVDDTTRTVDLIVPIKVTDRGSVFPGTTCVLQLHHEVPLDCVEMPVSALVPSIRGLWSCYRLERLDTSENYRVKRHDVTIIHTDGERVFVETTLSDGELYVSGGTHKLVPGMQVRVALGG